MAHHSYVWPEFPGIRSIADYELSLASSRMGVSGQIGYLFDDWESGLANWSTSHANGGTATQQNTKGGVMLFTTSTAAAGLGRLRRNNVAVTVGTAATDKFYFAAKMMIVTTVDANSRHWATLQNTVGIILGTNGPSSLTKFVAMRNGALLFTSTVDIDTTNYHILRFWRDGAKDYFAVDNEAVQSAASVALTNTGAYIDLQANKVGGAVDHQWHSDWVALAWETA